MANPAGIQGARQKPFRDALRLVIAEAEDNPRKLRRIAEKLYDAAASGDVQAIREIADRLDGKVAQAVVGGEDDDPALKHIHEIRRSIVDPRHPDGAGIPSTS